MPATFQSPVTAAGVHAAHDYRERGWTVTETANGRCLITDERVAAVELTGELAGDVSRFMHANNLLGPVVELPGARRRELHLVVGTAKAARAIAALREAGAVVHTDGASIPLPPTRLANGTACWKIAPDQARWVPPVVAIAAAARAAATARARQLAGVAC